MINGKGFDRFAEVSNRFFKLPVISGKGFDRLSEINGKRFNCFSECLLLDGKVFDDFYIAFCQHAEASNCFNQVIDSHGDLFDGSMITTRLVPF